MTRQRTLPGHLQPERSATKILTAPVAPSLEASAKRKAAPRLRSVAPELTSEKPPARAVGEGRASEIHRRRCWRRPSNPAIPHRPTEAPGISHDGNDFTPAVMRQPKGGLCLISALLKHFGCKRSSATSLKRELSPFEGAEAETEESEAKAQR
eukprot:s1113_g2.t1